MKPKVSTSSDHLIDAIKNIGYDGWDTRVVRTPDLADFFTKVDEDFYLVSVPTQNIKQIGNLKGSLEHFQNYVKVYGMDNVTVSKLDKETAKVLYGKK